MRELPLPPIAQQVGACEVLRAWSGDNLQVVLETTWQDPAAWGLLLVDIARHVARAYADAGNISEAAALTCVKAGFDAEWSEATDLGTRVHG
ncbi:hypothetical protein B0E51_17795 [Rhodanobacter sp. C05]|nr:hypothetical protein B0E51_17795 [Rhodanobacter sp. C05]